MKYIHTVDGISKEIYLFEIDKNQTLIPINHPKILRAEKCEYFIVRKQIAKMLEKATTLLPDGYQFKVFETYRSHKKQLLLWNDITNQLKNENPYKSQEEIELLANEMIANPHKIGSGHQTGGAIDITLCHKGREVDMGTKYLATDNPNSRTESKNLTPEQQKNRHLMKSILEQVGFVNYPPEWWHFSFGEHEWAVLTKHKFTLFRAIGQTPFQRE